MVAMQPTAKVNRIVARQAKPGTAEHALEIGVRAEANLTRHRRRGTHQITVTEGKTDMFVNLVGPGALSVEMGHWTGYKRREWVSGLRILRDAAGI